MMQTWAQEIYAIMWIIEYSHENVSLWHFISIYKYTIYLCINNYRLNMYLSKYGFKKFIYNGLIVNRLIV